MSNSGWVQIAANQGGGLEYRAQPNAGDEQIAIRQIGEAYPRIILRADGNVFTGDGTIYPSHLNGDASVYTGPLDPSGSMGTNGDIYFKIPLGAGTPADSLWQKLLGSWVKAATFSGASAKVVQIAVNGPADVVATGEELAYFRVPVDFDGLSLVSVAAHVSTVSTSGLPSAALRNITTGFDMLTTNVTIDANEHDSATAATPAAIDASHKVIHTADEIAVDVDAAGTNTQGLLIEMRFS